MSLTHPTRRKLLFSATGLITGLALFAGFRLPAFWAARQLRATVDAKFVEIFGPDIHSATASQNFLSDYVANFSEHSEQLYPKKLTLAFLQSSNVIEHRETGAALDYAGLFDPYATPCANRLGAIYAPERI